MSKSGTVSYRGGGRRRITIRRGAVRKVRMRGGVRMRPLHLRQGGRKRAASVSSVRQSKRPRSYRDPNQYRQMEFLQSKMGRRDRKGTFMAKLVKSSYNYTKYIMRSYNRDGDGGAAGEGLRQPLGWEQAGDVAFLPILIFNVTTIPQATASSTRLQHAGWRLTQNLVSGVVGFQALGTMLNDGTYAGTGWQEYVNQGTTAGVGNTSSTRRALMEYVNMKFRIRGPTARPTRVVVQLVQPYAWFLGNPEELLLTSGAITREHYQPWINLAAKNTANPVQSIPTSSKNPWRVLRTMAYDIQPTSTTEGDANGHDVVQKWFWKCNKHVAYDEHGYVNTDNSDATDLNIGDATTPDTNLTNWLGLGKRVYLIVSAYSPNSSGAFNPAIHPSFEYNFEKKLSSLTGQLMP